MADWRQLHPKFGKGDHVLVTGGAGFIGSHLTCALLDLGASVLVLDDFSGGDWNNLAPLAAVAGDRLQFIKGSILDEAAVARAVAGCRLVFHLAALGSVPRSVAEPRLYTQVNIVGTLNVLEAARAAKVERVMFAASSAAYGDTPVLPKIESMPVLPRSPYAASKVSCEALLMSYACCYGLDTAALRYFNIFGPRQNANSAYAAVIAAFAKALTAGQRPVIYGDGEQSRDFTFVDNAVHANLLAARCPRPIGGQVINIACGRAISVNQLAGLMAEQLGRPDLTPDRQAPRPGDVLHSRADLTRAGEVLGYRPIVDFEAGLQATVAWYRASLPNTPRA